MNKPYTCICGQEFSDERYLERHQAHHCAKAQKQAASTVRAYSEQSQIRTASASTGSKRTASHLRLADEERQMLNARFLGPSKRRARPVEPPILDNVGAPMPHSLLEPTVAAGLDEPDSSTFPSSEAEPLEAAQSLPTAVASTSALPQRRVRHLTERARAMLEDALPEGPDELQTGDEEQDVPPTNLPSPLRIRLRRIFKTAASKFRLTRRYHGRPSGIPQSPEFQSLIANDLQSPSRHTKNTLPAISEDERDNLTARVIRPYPNISTFLFNRWFWDGNQKTKADRRELQREVLGHPEFQIDDVVEANFDRLDTIVATNPGGITEGRGWEKSPVVVQVPTGKKETAASRREAASRRREARVDDVSDDETDEAPAARPFVVPEFHHRSLTDIVQEIFSGADASDFHWHPFEEYWQPPWPNAQEERVYTDTFSSNAFLEADKALQNSPPEPDCNLPRAIAAIMLYSDATHVAQFGQAKLWPIYYDNGNQSKYDRGRPSMKAGRNVAFLPTLPDSIADFIREEPSAKVTAPLLSHCRRELFHGCWKVILDDEFVNAYEHGIVINCGDGVRRRIYPRIFTYSADYPEKVLITTIRDLGQCPCPRCLVKKDQIPNLGSPEDMATRASSARKDTAARKKKVADARSLILKQGFVVNSARVEDLLKDESLVPTENAFSTRLGHLGLDFHNLIVVDQMHEVELGVWKALLQHLIRILNTQPTNIIHEFNSRFRQISSFGRGVVRAFPHNVSDLKRLAARDFEDILQCCIPSFENLLPSPHNQTVMDLLYTMNYWHSLSKLRMHTDTSLRLLAEVTTSLCVALRYFSVETCRHFQTVETDSEYQARSRAAARRVAKVTALGLEVDQAASLPQSSPALASNEPAQRRQPITGKRPKSFNLATSKAHALPDYVEQIKRFGTIDCISTKWGETRHSVIKDINDRTNFNNATPQIIKIDTRQAVHARMTQELHALNSRSTGMDVDPSPITSHSLAEPEQDLQQNYHIAVDERKSKVFLQSWLHDRERKEDPAFKDFLPLLKAHLVGRKRGLPLVTDVDQISTVDQDSVMIRDNCIFSHATATFNFTTYDVRRDQDTINVNSDRSTIMLPSFGPVVGPNGNPTHPYWYARVLGVFHANIYHPNSYTPERVEFLWVRWLDLDLDWQGGPSTLRLDRLRYSPYSDKNAFGFIDPRIVIRACHLIPVFVHERSRVLLPPSSKRDADIGDWSFYYVMRFVDRDMMMRYLGIGVGHRQSPEFPREDMIPMRQFAAPNYVTLPGSLPSFNEEQGGESEEDTSTGSDEDFEADIYEH